MQKLSRVRFTTALFGALSLAACDSVTAPASPSSTNAAASPSGSPSSLVGATLFVDPASLAAQTAAVWRTTRPLDAGQMDKIALQPQAVWFGNWNADIARDVAATTSRAATAGGIPVLVAYNIPQRDCGGLSGGNTTIASEYKRWIDGFALGLAGRRAVVVLEPDAVAGLDCLSSADQELRLSLLSHAAQMLAQAGAAVYIDAGHARWHSAATMAARLRQAGIARAAGFALNVSNFQSDQDNIAYGRQLGALVGNEHFIIDSGRNGAGATSDNQWCNPLGRALGTRPTTRTGVDGLDAFLWIKTPGESDGACNGAPSAGTWMPEYALGLAQRAAY